MDDQKVILNAFDIRKLKLRCNAPGCEKKPEFETMLYQRSPRKSRKNLASLYVCKDHLGMVQELVEEFRATNPRMITDFQKIEIKKGR